VVLYRDRRLRKHQFFACTQWPGYTVVNPTIQSSRTGGALAAAWAVLHFIGDEGYLEIARRLMRAARRIADGIREIDDLRLLGQPEMSLVAFTSDTVDVFHVADEMRIRGWYIQPQLAFAGGRESLHASINPANIPWVDGLLADLRTSVEKAKALPPGPLATEVQAMLAQVGPSGFSAEAFRHLAAIAGIEGAQLPERMAGINTVLNALPAELRDRLLLQFFDDLYTPSP
jgi:hypothetical protein